jgi:hypothetical protein
MKNMLLLLLAVMAVVVAEPVVVGSGAGSVGGVEKKSLDVGVDGTASENDSQNKGATEAVHPVVVIVAALIALLLLVLVIMFLISKLKNKEPDMDNNDESGIADGYGLEMRLTKRIDDIGYRIEELSNKLTTLINILSRDVGVQKGVADVSVASTMPVPSVRQSPPPVAERPKEIFYFANPVGGVFKAEKAKQTSDDALYRFERFVGEGKARISVIDEPRVARRFTERPEAQDGVCDDGGNFNQDAKRIEVLPGNEGIAVLEGDTWRVIQKIKIKYI